MLNFHNCYHIFQILKWHPLPFPYMCIIVTQKNTKHQTPSLLFKYLTGDCTEMMLLLIYFL